MASSSDHNSSPIHNSDLMDQRKRKRMQSNRESARKSRMRKQKHLDDLNDQIKQMKKDNEQILNTISMTTPQIVNVEAENSVLRAQMSELSQRLDYLNQIINLMNPSNCTSITAHCTSEVNGFFEFDNHNDFVNNPWGLMYLNHHPIMAAADMLQY